MHVECRVHPPSAMGLLTEAAGQAHMWSLRLVRRVSCWMASMQCKCFIWSTSSTSLAAARPANTSLPSGSTSGQHIDRAQQPELPQGRKVRDSTHSQIVRGSRGTMHRQCIRPWT
jgi:hypothetical protein